MTLRVLMQFLQRLLEAFFYAHKKIPNFVFDLEIFFFYIYHVSYKASDATLSQEINPRCDQTPRSYRQRPDVIIFLEQHASKCFIHRITTVATVRHFYLLKERHVRNPSVLKTSEHLETLSISVRQISRIQHSCRIKVQNFSCCLNSSFNAHLNYSYTFGGCFFGSCIILVCYHKFITFYVLTCRSTEHSFNVVDNYSYCTFNPEQSAKKISCHAAQSEDVDFTSTCFIEHTHTVVIQWIRQ